MLLKTGFFFVMWCQCRAEGKVYDRDSSFYRVLLHPLDPRMSDENKSKCGQIDGGQTKRFRKEERKKKGTLMKKVQERFVINFNQPKKEVVWTLDAICKDDNDARSSH